MAIAFDAFSAGTSGASPKTVAHTAAAPGANMAVYALVFNDTADTVTGVTYDGNAMTQRAKEITNGFSYIYEYIGTTTSGAKNVVASASSGTLYLSVITFTNVNAFDAGSNNADFGSTTLNLPITTVADNAFAVAILYDGGQTSTPTGGTNTTKAGANGDYSGIVTFYSTAAFTPAGAKNLVANVTAGGTNSWAIVSFSPTTGASTVTPSVNEAVTLTESVAMKMDLQNLAANEAVTVTDALTMHMPISLRMEKLS